MQQSWLTPFWPLLEKTEAKLFEPSAFTVPEVRRIKSCFFASFAIASAASLPLWRFSEFLPLLSENDLASPLNMEDQCPITSGYTTTTILSPIPHQALDLPETTNTTTSCDIYL